MANWDHEIDGAARRMTDVEVDAGFTSRVLARIDPDVPPPTRWPIWVWSPAALAMAAGLAALLVRAPWRSEPARTRADVAGASVRLEPRPGARPSTSSGRAVEGPALNARPSTSSGRAVEGPAAFGQVVLASELTPPALEIETIGVESMETMESIDIPRLAVDQIDVPAIGDE